MDETDVDSYFYHNIFDISQSQHRIVRVSKGSNIQSSSFMLFQFCDLKIQQRYLLQKEERRRTQCFGRQFDKASKCSQVPLPKPKVDIGSTKAKENLFTQYFNDIIENQNRQIRLSFRFGNYICVFIKKFEQHGNQLIVNLNHCEIHHLCRDRYYVANKCELVQGNYDLLCIHPWSLVWR